MALFGRRGRSGRRDVSGETRALYFASDIHGSEQCWRKFLGAGRHYGVDSLIMGGDVTGKAIVPVVLEPDGTFRATFLGELRTGSTEEELEQLAAAIRFNGMYPWVAPAAAVEAARASGHHRVELFDDVITEELARWLALAAERMPAYGIDVYTGFGNDDPPSCDAVLEAADYVQPVDERVVRVGRHEMISCAYVNPTPWKSPRELPESELYDRIHRLAEQLEDPSTAIFNLHAPPHDSGLDTANEINEDLTLRYVGGQPHPVPVGSTAVRQIIEEFQPLLSLHGHIHESRGETRIGRTLAVNPGSEYNSGHVNGALVTISDDEVVRHQLVVG